MKRICFVCFNAYALIDPASGAQIGGTEVQMALLARQLASLGPYSVSLLVGDFGQAKRVHWNGIAVLRSISLKKNLLTYLRAPFVLWKILLSIKPDYIISSPAGPEVGLLALYARVFKSKYIFRAASDIDATWEKMKALGFFAGALYAGGIVLAHRLVAQNKQQQESFQRYFNHSSTQIASSVVLAKPYSTSNKATRQTVLWVGSARAVKQPELFLQLAQALPDISFNMIMSHSGEERIYNQAERQAAALPNVAWLGQLAPQAVEQALAGAKMLVGTSAYEGMPNVYLLAFAAGIPVVSWKVNPNACITAYGTGYVAHGKWGKFVSAVEKLCSDEVDWEQKSRAGQAYAAHHHDPNAIMQQWRQLLSSL